MTKVKNQGGFPLKAVGEVLSIAGVAPKDVDTVAYSTIFFENPDLYDRDCVVRVYNDTFAPWRPSAASLRRQAIAIANEILGPERRSRLPFARAQRKHRLKCCADLGIENAAQLAFDHHRSHAGCLSYIFPNRLPHLRVTSDGQGDAISGRVTYCFSEQCRRDIVVLGREDSLAEVYSLATCILGLVPLEHEYKLMGLAPYASLEPKATSLAADLEQIFDWRGAEAVKWSRSRYHSTRKLARMLQALFRFQRMDHVASAVQTATEDIVLEWVKRLIRHTGCGRIGLAGGLFMNVKINGSIERMSEVNDLQVFPSCGDESLSLGCAALASEKYGQCPEWSGQIFLGRDFSKSGEILSAIDFAATQGIRITPCDDCNNHIATLLDNGTIVARFAGRAEFGARALGNRSILADPRRIEIISEINDRIKCRDFWMPFAATVLYEFRHELLEIPDSADSPFMMKTYRVRGAWLPKIRAAIHPRDGTCRPQILRREANPAYYSLIDEFRHVTGIPAVLNTSFNLHGYPLVYTPQDAVEVFIKSGLRVLLLDTFLLEK